MWFREHQFLVILSGIFILLIAGATLVWNKTATRPVDSGNSFGRLGGLSSISANQGSARQPGPLENSYTQEDLYSLLTEGSREESYASLIPQTNVYESRQVSTTTNNAFSYNENELEELLASIQPTARVLEPYDSFGDELALSDIFAFVPATVAATTSSNDERLTDTQSELFTYGNEAGSLVESHTDRWKDQALVLRAFFESPTTKNKTLIEDLAFSLTKVGKNLEDMEIVPNNIRDMHSNIATGYKNLGDKLNAVAFAENDEELLNAVVAYNESADAFAADFLELVNVFSVAEITYSQDEPGKAFIFSPAPTLR